MFENVADGLLGLFMFFSNWISPAGDSQTVKLGKIREEAGRYYAECQIRISWNDQLSDIIDAGIPFQLRIASHSDKGDSLAIIRTLVCDISNYTYTLSDSGTVLGKKTVTSKKYDQIFKALRDLDRWECSFSNSINALHVRVDLLPSRVSTLNRMVDLSDLCECGQYSLDLLKPQEKQ